MKLNKISSVFNLNKFAKSNVAIFGATLAAVLAMPTYAAEAEVAAEDLSDVEVIEVTGMMGSMKAAALLKRADNRIVDAIVAEDIGKLPDNNIAEALQRITGISIDSDFGVGESVTIRGISDNRVELNGRSTSGTGRGGISLDDFPSSFLKTVEVIKSPTPEMIEGALGGTVNMKTVRPLELDEPLVAITFDAEYADKTENVAPKFNISAGDNWDMGDAGTFGATAVFSYLDREIRQDEFQTKMNSYNTGDIEGFDEVGNGPNETITVRSENTVRIKTEERERTAFGASLQWAPQSEAGMVYLDLSGSQLEGGQKGYDFLDVGTSPTANANTYQGSTGLLMNYNLENAFVIPKTESDFEKNDSYSHALGGEWQLTEKLKISGEVAITGSTQDGVNSQLNLRPVDREAYEDAVALDPTASPGDYMNKFLAQVANKGGQVSGITYSDPTALTNPDTMAIREMFYDKNKTENDETAMRLDAEYDEPMGLEWISSVKVGVRVTSREYEFQNAELQNNNGDTFKDAYKKAMVLDDDGNETDVYVTPTFLGDFDGIAIINHDNLYDQAGIFGGANPLTGDVAAYDADLLSNDANGTFKKFQAMMVGTTYATTGSLSDNLYDLADEWKKIEEETSAIYAQFNLDFDEVTAVVGGRYVTTDLDSSIMEDGNVLTRSNDYTDFLPSINVNWSVLDDTMVRFAAAKVMRRAGFDELSPALDIDSTLIGGTQGSYQLDPKRVTQFDLSVEHYFGDGGAISAAIFYKDVNSFTVDTNFCMADSSTVINQSVDDEWQNICLLETAGTDNSALEFMPNTTVNGEEAVEALQADGLTGINIATSTNGGSGEVIGLELAYQQQFSMLPGAWSGLGLATNYTYAESEQPNGLPLENISDHSANVQVFWEYEKFQTRLAYNWRSEYMDDESIGKRALQGGELGYGSDVNRTDPTSISDVTGVSNYDPTSENSYRQARGQLDWSASYDINDNFTVVANATNLTGEALIYQTAQGHDWRLTEADRRLTLGVRAKF